MSDAQGQSASARKRVLVITRYPEREIALCESLRRAGFLPSAVSVECVVRDTLYLPVHPSLVLAVLNIPIIEAIALRSRLDRHRELRYLPVHFEECPEAAARKVQRLTPLLNPKAPFSIPELMRGLSNEGSLKP